MPPFASVIILSRNQFDSDTRPCLDSLLSDCENREAEIIVVDNGSDQTTQNGLDEYDDIPNVKVIRNSQDIGFSSANNRGIRASSGKVVVLLNNDTVVPKGAIRKMALLLEDHPDWGAWGQCLTLLETNREYGRAAQVWKTYCWRVKSGRKCRRIFPRNEPVEFLLCGSSRRHWIQLDYWMRISALFIMRMLITACEFLVRENG